MPQSSSIDRFPSGRRNELMEMLSRNALRLRGRKTTAALGGYGREDSIEALVGRLGVIPVFLWPTATAGAGNEHAMPPPQGGAITVAQTDASTPATDAFTKPGASVAHTFTTPSVKQTLTATYAGNANTKGRAAAII